MPDLNKQIAEIGKDSREIEFKLSEFFKKYDNLYREGNSQFNTEKTASAGSMDGLEEFRRLILIIRRNKDIVASLMRGVSNFRPLSNFRFIEEEVRIPVQKKRTKKIKSAVSEIIVPELTESEGN